MILSRPAGLKVEVKFWSQFTCLTSFLTFVYSNTAKEYFQIVNPYLVGAVLKNLIQNESYPLQIL